MSKAWKGAIIMLLVILIIGVFVGLGIVSNWFQSPVEEWGSHWQEIIDVVNQTPVNTDPVEPVAPIEAFNFMKNFIR